MRAFDDRVLIASTSSWGLDCIRATSGDEVDSGLKMIAVQRDFHF